MADRKIDRSFRRFLHQGDLGALGEAFDLAAPELLRVARHLCPDEASAEDAVQSTFQTVIERRNAFSEEGRLMPWMLGILARLAKKARARAVRTPQVDRLEERTVADPADAVAQSELRSIVADRMQELPVTYAQVVRSYLFDGQRPAEIAQALGISRNAARVRVHRGLNLLRKALPAGAAIGVASAAHGELPALVGLKERVLDQAGRSLAKSASTSAVSTGVGSTLGNWIGSMTSGSFLKMAGVAAVASLGTYTWNHTRHEREIHGLHLELDQAMAERQAMLERQEVLTDETRGTQLATAEAPADARESVAAEAPRPVEEPALTPEQWLARFEEAEGWREGLAIGYEIAALDPDEALEVMRAIYARIPQVAHRQQILKPFVFHGGHIHAVEILHLAASDPSMEVQDRAFGYLSAYAYRDFSEDYSAYEQWYATWGGRPLAEILTGNAEDLVRRASLASLDELRTLLNGAEDLDLRPGQVAGVDLAAVLREAGLLATMSGWLTPGVDREAQELALAWVESLQPDEAWLRNSILPMLTADRTLHPVDDAWRVLGQRQNTWALEPMLTALVELRGPEPRYFSPARALAELGDPRAIPTMIALIVADDDYPSVYGIGYFGLEKLTGVRYDESHDGAWWLEWWDKNQARLPETIRGLSIPQLVLPN